MRLSFSILVFFASAIACRPPQGEATGDEGWSGAGDIQPYVLVDDKVAARGDPTDFKRFRIEEPTPVTINVYWDNPEIRARVALYDQFGGLLAQVEHPKGAEKDTLGPVDLKQEGTYFVEISAKAGASVYTIELISGNPDEGGGSQVPFPE